MANPLIGSQSCGLSIFRPGLRGGTVSWRPAWLCGCSRRLCRSLLYLCSFGACTPTEIYRWSQLPLVSARSSASNATWGLIRIPLLTEPILSGLKKYGPTKYGTTKMDLSLLGTAEKRRGTTSPRKMEQQLDSRTLSTRLRDNVRLDVKDDWWKEKVHA